MFINIINSSIDTEKAYETCNENSKKFEESTRICPIEAYKFPIGFVIPLGTLKDEHDRNSQFTSNFHIVAYTIADELLDKTIDFEDFNIECNAIDQGSIYRSTKKINNFVQSKLGNGWKVTLFNVSIPTAIKSLCKGIDTVESVNKAIGIYENIIYNRINKLVQASEDGSTWENEVVELFYDKVNTLSNNFVKVIDNRHSDKNSHFIECNSIGVELLVYDRYANGLRLLSGVDSFASSKIRLHNFDNKIYPFVLKARVQGEDSSFKPIRQFGGKSIITKSEITSGCTERIIYNIVNKNYKHWSFLSIPEDIEVVLK